MCYITGAKDENGVSWCPDCTRYDGIIEHGLNDEDKPILKVSVGREEWMGNDNHPFKQNPVLNVASIPAVRLVHNNELLFNMEIDSLAGKMKIKDFLFNMMTGDFEHVPASKESKVEEPWYEVLDKYNQEDKMKDRLYEITDGVAIAEKTATEVAETTLDNYSSDRLSKEEALERIYATYGIETFDEFGDNIAFEKAYKLYQSGELEEFIDFAKYFNLTVTETRLESILSKYGQANHLTKEGFLNMQ